MDTSAFELTRQAIILASWGQITIAGTTAIALRSIQQVGEHEQVEIGKDRAVLWLSRACWVWFAVGAFQLYCVLSRSDLSLFIPNLADRAASPLKAIRQCLSIVNSICLLIAASYLEIYQDRVGNQGPKVWPPIQWVATRLRDPRIQVALWFWAVLPALTAPNLPQAYYVLPDFLIAIPTTGLLLYGLYESFRARNFSELALLSIITCIPIALAEFGELWGTFGIWRWLIITVFKTMLCLLFVALAYSWIYRKLTGPVEEKYARPVLLFRRPWLDKELVIADGQLEVLNAVARFQTDATLEQPAGFRDAPQVEEESYSHALDTDEHHRPRLQWFIAAVLVFAAGIVIWSVVNQPRPQPLRSFTSYTSFYDHATYSMPTLATFALSPDGQRLAYADGRGKLQVWTVNQLDPVELPYTDGASFPFWAQPDGNSLGFFAEKQLKKIRLRDGQPPGLPETLCHVPDPRGGTWYDDTIVYSPGPASMLKKISASAPGDTPSEVFVPAEVSGQGQRFPQFMPGGKSFFYHVLSDQPGIAGLYIGSLDGQHRKNPLLHSETNALVAPSIANSNFVYLLYRNEEDALTVWQFDPERVEAIDLPQQLAISKQVMGTGYDGSGAFAVSKDILAYRRPEDRELVIFDKNGNRVRNLTGPERIRPDSPLALSPDGKTLAFSKGPGWKSNIFRQEIQPNGVQSQVTFGDTGASWYPAWSRDGSLYYGFQAKGAVTGELRSLPHDPSEKMAFPSRETVNTGPWDVSKDGRWLLYRRNSPSSELWLRSLPKGAPQMYLKSNFDNDFKDGRFSPDSKWIAYSSNEGSSQFQVYVRSIGGGAPQRVSSQGGSKPRWRSDGQILYYLSDDGKIMEVPVDLNGRVRANRAHAIFGAESNHELAGISDYVPIDGEQFIVNLPAGGAKPPAVIIVQNWQALIPGVQLK